MPDTAPSIPLPPSSGTICVVGAGFMGCVIATLYAHHGHDVALCDMNTELLASFAERARPIAATFADDPAAVDAHLHGGAGQSDVVDAHRIGWVADVEDEQALVSGR